MTIVWKWPLFFWKKYLHLSHSLTFQYITFISKHSFILIQAKIEIFGYILLAINHWIHSVFIESWNFNFFFEFLKMMNRNIPIDLCDFFFVVGQFRFDLWLNFFLFRDFPFSGNNFFFGSFNFPKTNNRLPCPSK